MDSTELQSDSLEAKGRDELITIATALGGKPASRARKAEIVEMILELSSGGGAPTPETQEPANQDQAEDETEPLAEWEVALQEESKEETSDDSSKSDETSKSDEKEGSESGSSRAPSGKDSETRSSNNNREKRSGEY